MPSPIPFLTAQDDGKFAVSAEAKELLIKVQAPLAVVAVAGLWRTGKSFLLNSLLGLNGLPESFVVGSTVNACTKGLWIWGEPVTLPDGLTVLFVDSEGLGSTTRTATEDVQIFSLAVLLSSSFIWNSRGVIDGNALDDFGLVVHLSKHIHVSSNVLSGEGSSGGEGVGQSLSEHFPSFMWVVRDFTLRLERNGRPLGDADYLEEALKASVKDGRPDSRDEIRKLLRHFFKRRDCVTLVRPAEDEKVLRSLSSQPLSSLRPDFVRALQGLKEKVFAGAKPKMMHGREVSGAMLVTLADSYAAAVNEGGVPTISTAWNRVVATQAKASALIAVNVYRQALATAVGLGPDQLRAICVASDRSPLQVSQLPRCLLPLESRELAVIHAQAKAEALASFARGAWSDAGAHGGGASVRALMTAERSSLTALNLRYSYVHCLGVADRLVADLASEEAATATMGGFTDRARALVERYTADSRGAAREAVLAQVLCTKLAALPLHGAARAVGAGRSTAKELKALASRAAEQADGLMAKCAAETDAGRTEASATERATAEARVRGEAGVVVEQARLEAKRCELVRAEADLGRLELAYEHCLGALSKMIAGDKKLVGDLHDTYMSLLLQSTSHDLALALPPPSEADAAQGGELLARVAVERAEVELLLTHTSLVQQNIRATTELIGVKEAEVSEREFQWGMAKASVAHEEGEAMTVDEEVSVLRTLATKLKSHISTTNQLIGLASGMASGMASGTAGGRLSYHGAAAGTPADFVRELDSKQKETLRNLEATHD